MLGHTGGLHGRSRRRRALGKPALLQGHRDRRRLRGRGVGETMGSIHSATSLVARLGLRRFRKDPVRSGRRAASRIVAFLAVAVMIGGATAAQAAASTGPFTGPSVMLNGNDTDIAVQGPNDSLTFYYAADG